MKIKLLLIILTVFSLNAQEKNAAKMQWFEDAKLGIFIHYGIYAVDGTSESWSFYNKETTYEQYMSQLNGFTAANYNPDSWAKLFKEAGAKYAVLTAKHHDGVALWETKQSQLNVVNKSPAKRDLIAPYATAMRAAGLKVGIYFSHLDWSEPTYGSVLDGKNPNQKNPSKWDYQIGRAHV